MDDILKYCIRVNGISSYYPIYDEVSTHVLDGNPEYARKFGWNNGKVAFITEDGSYYVTPFCFEVAEALRQQGYEDIGLYVPFSNGDVPNDEKLQATWKNLCEEARRKYDEKKEEERLAELKRVAEEKGLKELPEEVYKMSLELPKDGLKTIWWGSEESMVSPLEPETLPEVIGTYYQNNGRVSFVDANGTMHVTPFTSEVRELLEEAGYKQGSLYVPLSNGEQIADPTLAAKWQIMCQEARELHDTKEKQAKARRIKELAEEKGLEELPEEVYELSLQIPEEGLDTIWWGFEKSKVEPIDEYSLPEVMGTYWQNNGKVSYVDSHGRMLVTPFCSEIREHLAEAGYKERSLYVPLSNGEQVADPALAERWTKLCEAAKQNQAGSGGNGKK